MLAMGGLSPIRAADPVYITDFAQTHGATIDAGVGSNVRVGVEAYALVSKLAFLADGDPDEVRFWVTAATFDPRTNGIATVGYVVSGSGGWVCRIVYRGKETAPSKGECRAHWSLKRRRGVLSDIAALARMSGHSYSCRVMDGYWVSIEGVSEGRRFMVQADNPSSCNDKDSQFIAAALEKVW